MPGSSPRRGRLVRDAYAGAGPPGRRRSSSSWSRPRLDDRTTDVLDALADGATTVAQVAADLGVDPSATVEGALANALALLHRHARTEAMAYAVANPVEPTA